MTVTLNLPPEIERAFQGEARARGLSLDEFLSEVVLARSGVARDESAVGGFSSGRLMYDEGVPILRTGHAISVSVVKETLERIRRERERAVLGLSD